jgi:glyoxylase-like metal-dependent hydrolase (beta-lactamase superfamily II)
MFIDRDENLTERSFFPTFSVDGYLKMDVNTLHGPLSIGDIELSWLQGGFFHLDGGTMFGPVPKVLWQKRYAVDKDNLIPMCNDPLLVRTGDMNILIDTGIGNKLSEKQRTIYKVTSPWDIPSQLEARGITRDDIDLVVLTRCDFDHAGGIQMLAEEGNMELTFPRARHIIHEKEWQDVKNPDSRAQSTYLPENFDLLEKSGRLELADDAMTLCPGITVFHSGGHTRGHQVVEILSQGSTAIHLGDLCPTHAHLNPLWVMAYDNFPLDVIARKEEYLRKYSGKDRWFTFYHDPFVRACKLSADGSLAGTW